MVVDDDEDTRTTVVEVLEGAGYEALAVPGGTAALRMMREKVPTLVLADLTMFDIDGRAFLIRARELLGTSTPPFVFLTGLEPSSRSDVTEAVLAKPFAIDDLLSIVKRHFRA